MADGTPGRARLPFLRRHGEPGFPLLRPALRPGLSGTDAAPRPPHAPAAAVRRPAGPLKIGRADALPKITLEVERRGNAEAVRVQIVAARRDRRGRAAKNERVRRRCRAGAHQYAALLVVIARVEIFHPEREARRDHPFDAATRNPAPRAMRAADGEAIGGVGREKAV